MNLKIEDYNNRLEEKEEEQLELIKKIKPRLNEKLEPDEILNILIEKGTLIEKCKKDDHECRHLGISLRYNETRISDLLNFRKEPYEELNSLCRGEEPNVIDW